MFSGIIEDIGTIRKVEKKKNLIVLSIAASRIYKGVKTGDSISIDGVCLTVTTRKGRAACFDVMKETIRATTLKNAQAGTQVNMERALTLNSRINGHFVFGHVDDVGVIKDRIRQDNYVEYRISANRKLFKYIVPKGSVSIDGISLTVGHVSRNWFSVYIIPHTIKVTTLKGKGKRDEVNVETDILAKYVIRSGKKR